MSKQEALDVIDNITRAIHEVEREFYLATEGNGICNIIIYMQAELKHDLMGQMNGPITSIAMELYDHNSMRGYPVVVVNDKRHNRYEIYSRSRT